MTIVEVMDNLAVFLREALADYKIGYPTADEKTTAITVYSGYPAARTGANAKESYIYTLVVKTTDNQDESTAEVQIGFNIYSEATSDQGRALFNIMEHVRQQILQHPCIANRMMLRMPVKGQILDEQPAPQYLGLFNAEYTIGRPSEVDFNYDF